jgi:hypothetical protein
MCSHKYVTPNASVSAALAYPPFFLKGVDWFKDLYDPANPLNMRWVPFNGGLSQTQLEWLETTVKKAVKHGERMVVMSHVPTYPGTEQGNWRNGTQNQNRRAIYDIFVYLSPLQKHFRAFDYSFSSRHVTLQEQLPRWRCCSILIVC